MSVVTFGSAANAGNARLAAILAASRTAKLVRCRTNPFIVASRFDFNSDHSGRRLKTSDLCNATLWPIVVLWVDRVNRIGAANGAIIGNKSIHTAGWRQ